MKRNSIPSPASKLSCIALSLALLPLASADAAAPTTVKLHAQNTTAQSEAYFGHAVAAGETYVMVGEPRNDDDGSDADTQPDENTGAVHVFNAVTGAFVRKLRPAELVTKDSFGGSVAVCGKLGIVGAPGRDGGKGMAYVFDLSTGQILQRLTTKTRIPGDFFGLSVALSGNMALVGAIDVSLIIGPGGNPRPGSAYVFKSVGVLAAEIRTPSLTLLSSDGLGGDQFGHSVALCGHLALVGAPYADIVDAANVTHTNQGAAYLFDAENGGAELHKFTAGADRDEFGGSVAMDGRLALIGARHAAVNGNLDQGAAYLFDVVEGGTPLRQLIAAESDASDSFGECVSLSGHLALVGASRQGGFQSPGAAYLFDAPTGGLVTKLTALYHSTEHLYANAVSLCGNRALIGAYFDDDFGTKAGAAYLIQPLAGPFPMETMAVLQDFAPGAPQTTFNSFGDAFMTHDGEVVFPATLIGAGAAGGKNLGLWSTMAPGQPLDLVMQSGVGFSTFSTNNNPDDRKPTGFFKPIANQPDFGIYEVSFTGTGVTAANNRSIFSENGTGIRELLRLGQSVEETGGPVPQGTGPKIAKFTQFVQPMFDPQQAVLCQFVPGSGTPAVTAASDSGIIQIGNDRHIYKPFFEGELTGTGTYRYGQFNRVALGHKKPIFMAGLQGGDATAANNQAIFTRVAPNPSVMLAQKGGIAPDATGAPMPGVKFAAFTGETTSYSEEAVFRATLTGQGVTTANDEALFWQHDSSGGASRISPLRLAVREGDQVTDQNSLAVGAVGASRITNPLPGVVYSRFISFWGMDVVGVNPDPQIRGQILFLAVLRGTGVTTLNDTALCLLEESNPPAVRILLREGDPAAGCGAATIGTINRVAAIPYYAQYAVQVTLANAPVASNQAIYRGATVVLPRTPFGILRRPFLALRKGTLFQFPGGGTTKLQSASLPASALDATGAGGIGLGLPINAYGEMVLNATFTDLAVHLVRGAP